MALIFNGSIEAVEQVKIRLRFFFRLGFNADRAKNSYFHLLLIGP